MTGSASDIPPGAAPVAVWLLGGDPPIRDATAAEYALRWIDKLQDMADAWPGSRFERERAHGFSQFDETRDVCRRSARERVRPRRRGAVTGGTSHRGIW